MTDAARRGSAVPARLRIVGWILLTTALGLAAVVITVRSSLIAQVDRAANVDVEQEVDEFRTFAAQGVDPTTAAPFTSTARLLQVHLDRQFPEPIETVLGVAESAEGPQVITQRRRGPYDLGADATLLRRITGSPAASGIEATPAGEMRWGRVDVEPLAPGDGGGSFVIASFTGPPREVVDATMRLVGLVSVGGLALTAVIAFLVAGRILAPVRTVRRAAAEITERDLTRRLPVEGSDDIAAMTLVFNQMLDRLDAAFAGQRRFVEDATRELEAPVERIRGTLARARDGADPVLTEVRHELDRMHDVLSDLAVLAQAERPEFVQPRRVEVDHLVRGLLDRARPTADRRWDVESLAGLDAELDPQRVGEALDRLVENAVQHTGPGDRIGVGAASAGDGRVRLWVSDAGPGVAAEDATSIFERFRRGQASIDSGRRGAGLGLAVVRAVADAHEGSAWVESTPGRGATFGVELPVRAVASGVPVPAAPPDDDARPEGLEPADDPAPAPPGVPATTGVRS